MGNAAKKQRIAANTFLSECVRSTKRYYDSPNNSLRLLQQKLTELNEAKENLFEKQCVYADKNNLDPDSEELQSWITPKLDDANDLADLLFERIATMKDNEVTAKAVQDQASQKAIHDEELKNECEILTIQCERNTKVIEDQITNMNEVVNNVNRTEDADKDLVRSFIINIENALGESTKSWNKLKSFHVKDQNKLKEVFDQEMRLKTTFATHRTPAGAFCGFDDTSSIVVKDSDSVSVSNNGTSTNPKLLDMQKVKPPTFSGDIRSFAKFRADFKMMIEPKYSDATHQAYILKQNCLKGEALDITKNLNEVSKIWERLHDKYGDETEIMNIVIKEIEEHPQTNSNSAFVQLVNTLEKGLQDLEIIGMSDEVANVYTVKILEKKLSNRVLTKWLEKESVYRSAESSGTKRDGKTRFNQIFSFLKDERRQTERLMVLKPDSRPPPPKERSLKHVSAGALSGNGANNNNNGSSPVPARFNNNCLVHPDCEHLTRKCRKFKSMDVVQRGQLVKDTGGCKLCLSLSHVGVDECPLEAKFGKCPVNGCDESHSSMVHGCKIVGISAHARLSTTNITIQAPDPETTDQVYSTTCLYVLLLIERIETEKTFVLTFWDSGSTISLVCTEYVKRTNLVGVPVSYDLVTVGGVVTTHHSTLYEITLIDRMKKTHTIQLYEIEDICGEMGSINVAGVVHLFPSATIKDVERRSGKIEMLIGMEHAALHPKPICEKEGLVLYQSLFGTGKILGGAHPAVTTSDRMNAAAQRTAHAHVFNTRVRKIDAGVDFFTSEEFGVSVPARCKSCKGCKNCRFELHELSRNEQYELDVIRSNAQLDPTNNRWTTTYPFKVDPRILDDNKEQAIALMKKQEKRLLKNQEDAEQYRKVFQEFINRGVITEITEEEQKNWTGPVFYITAHEVKKEESSSTPIRLVINPSLKYKGRSLNDLLMKGPNTLNDLFGILIRFRTHTYGLVADIKKMYHTIHTTEVERHVRRLVFRDLDPTKEPKIYGPTRVMFGDRPAAAISTVCIKETAETFKHIDEKAAEMINDDMYVDDLTSGAESTDDIEERKKGITEILIKGGFEIKGFVSSYDDSPETLALLGTGEIGRILGVRWDPTRDEFAFVIKINLSKKIKGVHSEPDLTVEQIPRLIEMKLTRAILLSIVNSCYDPLGVLCCILIQLKIKLRDLHRADLNLGWDDPIPNHMKEDWISLLQLLKSTESVRFPRCVRPANSVGDPDLVMFNDGSNDAMCTASYLRWKLTSGEYDCSLWSAKTRVTPLKKSTIPRIEMTSAVMSSRLCKTIKEYGGLSFQNVYYILDSTSTMYLMRKSSVALKEFMSNRVTEFLEVATPDQVYHVKSRDNIADLGTRMDATAADIDRGSAWQCGPPWLKMEVSDWPVSQDYSNAEIPQEELNLPHVVAAITASINSTQLFDTERYKNRYRAYEFFVKLVGIVVKMFKNKSFKIQRPLSVEDLKTAELVCLKLSMKLTLQDHQKGTLKSLRAKINEEGIVVIGSRATEGLKVHYGPEEFPVLTYRDPLSYLWMKKVHDENHTGITTTVAKSRRKYWIVRGRCLAKKVKSSCYRCRLVDKLLAEQLMSPLPLARLRPSPAWYVTSMDLFGPILIKDTVKQRTRKKVWGVIFNCLASRAVHIDVSEDYGTDSILQVIRRFICVRKSPSEILSDQGSQLIAAAKDIAELASWDWSPIEQYCTERKIKWTLAPAEGQHQNGASEALIKSTKRTIKHTVGNHVCTTLELQTVFYEIANIINSRPLGITSGSDPSNPTPITPNGLLTGDDCNDVPQGPFDTKASITKRFRFLQELVGAWWEQWYKVVLPSLVPSYKWMQRHRSVCVGDVCLIRYKNDTRATYRLGRVTEVKKGSDDLVRKVSLEYKLPDEKKFRSVERPIHGIAVIVPIEEQEIQGLNPNASDFVPNSNSK